MRKIFGFYGFAKLDLYEMAFTKFKGMKVLKIMQRKVANRPDATH